MYGLRWEAKRHTALDDSSAPATMAFAKHPKRCRRCAVPPHSMPWRPFGLRWEAIAPHRFGCFISPGHLGFAKNPKRCRRCALPPHSTPWRPFGLRWEAKRHTALDVSSTPATWPSRRIQSGVAAVLCHRTPCIGGPLDCGGKRSATPLWMIRRDGATRTTVKAPPHGLPRR